MKKFLKRIALVSLLLILVFAGAVIYFRQQQANLYAGLQTGTLQRGPITVTIGATGSVRSNQSAYLVWKTSGEVDQVLFQVGDQVSQADILATLVPNSLPPYILLAQAELIGAQRYLDGLLQSETQRALALKAVDEAQTALEQALNPDLALAQAQLDLAQAQADLEAAEYQYEILVSTPSQLSIDQAYANWILAQQGLADLQVELESARNKANLNPERYLPWENKETYLQLVEVLEAQEAALKTRLEQAEQKYNNLLAPPDALDVKVAETAVQTAQAQLDETQAEWERLQAGPSAGDIAVLEARLADAQREWERVKDGPDPADISIAEANIAAAKATLDSIQLYAPFDGTLTQLFIQPGDQVQPGTLALRVDDLSQILVDLQISEVDVNRIQPGLPVVL
ncbi:MAG: efflux RND transporter periplasmic adaptor subunit, partial [Anaerolineales bacterium]|nr:efflux RND transporter periplasmic adaptor subunit [Anaerolineales bacterium]